MVNFQNSNFYHYDPKSKNIFIQKNINQSQSNTNTNSVETGMKSFYDNGASEAMAEKAKENTEKIKALTEEAKNLKLSSNPTQEEIENFKTKAASLRDQAYVLYDEVDNFHYGKGLYRFKANEKDELFHALDSLVKLLDNKLAMITRMSKPE